MKHGYTDEDDGATVALRMSRADYNRLLVIIGYYGGELAPAELEEHLAFADRLNEGNPRWRRYTPFARQV